MFWTESDMPNPTIMSLAIKELFPIADIPNLNFTIGITAGKGKPITTKSSAGNATKGCCKSTITKRGSSKVDSM